MHPQFWFAKLTRCPPEARFLFPLQSLTSAEVPFVTHCSISSHQHKPWPPFQIELEAHFIHRLSLLYELTMTRLFT